MLQSQERTLDLDFLAGLPRPFFHFALLWTHKEQTRKDIESRIGRRTVLTGVLRDFFHGPGVGWTGRICYDDKLRELCKQRSHLRPIRMYIYLEPQWCSLLVQNFDSRPTFLLDEGLTKMTKNDNRVDSENIRDQHHLHFLDRIPVSHRITGRGSHYPQAHVRLQYPSRQSTEVPTILEIHSGRGQTL